MFFRNFYRNIKNVFTSMVIDKPEAVFYAQNTNTEMMTLQAAS